MVNVALVIYVWFQYISDYVDWGETSSCEADATHCLISSTVGEHEGMWH